MTGLLIYGTEHMQSDLGWASISLGSQVCAGRDDQWVHLLCAFSDGLAGESSLYIQDLTGLQTCF